MKYKNSFAQLFLRLALGIGFILPVMDRLGLLGAPGAKGVTWGNWENFTAYTNQILPFLSHSAASAAGFFATLAEVIFAIGLIIGFKTKYMAAGTALLTGTFGVSMAIFLGISAPFGYPVFVFTGGAWVLSQVTHYAWSLDAVFKKENEITSYL